MYVPIFAGLHRAVSQRVFGQRHAAAPGKCHPDQDTRQRGRFGDMKTDCQHGQILPVNDIRHVS